MHKRAARTRASADCLLDSFLFVLFCAAVGPRSGLVIHKHIISTSQNLCFLTTPSSHCHPKENREKNESFSHFFFFFVPSELLSPRPLNSMTAWTTPSTGSSECPTRGVATWKLWDGWRGWWTNWKRCVRDCNCKSSRLEVS